MKNLGSKTIETERLILKPQTMDEQYTLWKILMIPEVNKYYLTVPKKFRDKLKDWDKQEEYYKKEIEHANDLDVYKWSVFIKDNGECIGRVTCQDIEKDTPSIRDVGWYIDPKYQGVGYGTEASHAMIDYMFRECDIDGINTGAAIINPPSWKIMESYGFKRRDTTRFVEYTFLDEQVEIYEYYITKEMFLNK